VEKRVSSDVQLYNVCVYVQNVIITTKLHNKKSVIKRKSEITSEAEYLMKWSELSL